MDREDKAKCQCCGKMMVPRVVVSRGVIIAAIRLGEGVTHNVCPFCLSEDWQTGRNYTAVQRFFQRDIAWYMSLFVWFIILAITASFGVEQFATNISDDSFLIVLGAALMVSVGIATATCRYLGGKRKAP